MAVDRNELFDNIIGIFSEAQDMVQQAMQAAIDKDLVALVALNEEGYINTYVNNVNLIQELLKLNREDAIEFIAENFYGLGINELVQKAAADNDKDKVQKYLEQGAHPYFAIVGAYRSGHQDLGKSIETHCYCHPKAAIKGAALAGNKEYIFNKINDESLEEKVRLEMLIDALAGAVFSNKEKLVKSLIEKIQKIGSLYYINKIPLIIIHNTQNPELVEFARKNFERNYAEEVLAAISMGSIELLRNVIFEKSLTNKALLDALLKGAIEGGYKKIESLVMSISKETTISDYDACCLAFCRSQPFYIQKFLDKLPKLSSQEIEDLITALHSTVQNSIFSSIDLKKLPEVNENKLCLSAARAGRLDLIKKYKDAHPLVSQELRQSQYEGLSWGGFAGKVKSLLAHEFFKDNFDRNVAIICGALNGDSSIILKEKFPSYISIYSFPVNSLKNLLLDLRINALNVVVGIIGDRSLVKYGLQTTTCVKIWNSTIESSFKVLKEHNPELLTEFISKIEHDTLRKMLAKKISILFGNHYPDRIENLHNLMRSEGINYYNANKKILEQKMPPDKKSDTKKLKLKTKNYYAELNREFVQTQKEKSVNNKFKKIVIDSTNHEISGQGGSYQRDSKGKKDKSQNSSDSTKVVFVDKLLTSDELLDQWSFCLKKIFFDSDQVEVSFEKENMKISVNIDRQCEWLIISPGKQKPTKIKLGDNDEHRIKILKSYFERISNFITKHRLAAVNYNQECFGLEISLSQPHRVPDEELWEKLKVNLHQYLLASNTFKAEPKKTNQDKSDKNKKNTERKVAVIEFPLEIDKVRLFIMNMMKRESVNFLSIESEDSEKINIWEISLVVSSANFINYKDENGVIKTLESKDLLNVMMNTINSFYSGAMTITESTINKKISRLSMDVKLFDELNKKMGLINKKFVEECEKLTLDRRGSSYKKSENFKDSFSPLSADDQSDEDLLNIKPSKDKKNKKRKKKKKNKTESNLEYLQIGIAAHVSKEYVGQLIQIKNLYDLMLNEFKNNLVLEILNSAYFYKIQYVFKILGLSVMQEDNKFFALCNKVKCAALIEDDRVKSTLHTFFEKLQEFLPKESNRITVILRDNILDELLSFLDSIFKDIDSNDLLYKLSNKRERMMDSLMSPSATIRNLSWETVESAFSLLELAFNELNKKKGQPTLSEINHLPLFVTPLTGGEKLINEAPKSVLESLWRQSQCLDEKIKVNLSFNALMPLKKKLEEACHFIDMTANVEYEEDLEFKEILFIAYCSRILEVFKILESLINIEEYRFYEKLRYICLAPFRFEDLGSVNWFIIKLYRAIANQQEHYEIILVISKKILKDLSKDLDLNVTQANPYFTYNPPNDIIGDKSERYSFYFNRNLHLSRELKDEVFKLFDSLTVESHCLDT